MARKLSPYEKNQLLKFGLSTDINDDNLTPVEYLTGHVEFCRHDFLVTHHTLIPRIETEEIIDLVLSNLPSNFYDLSSANICDVGTGSGALGISLSLALDDKKIPHQLFLSDISLEALTTAKLNALRLLPEPSNPTVLQSDLFIDYPQTIFDVITANLPYVPTERIGTLDASVSSYEPHLALDGGPRGASIINRLLLALPGFTKSRSLAVFEIDHTHTLEDFEVPEGFTAEILSDSYGQPRFLKVIRS